MNLQEQINRTKTLMGLKPLNEGVLRKSGSLKDILKGVFEKEPQQVVTNPFVEKYGNILTAPTSMFGVTLNASGQETNNNVTTTTQTLCKVFISTTQPQPMPSDVNKKVTHASYKVELTETINGQETITIYFKSAYYIDNVLTDHLSSLSTNGQESCVSNSLEGKTEACQFPQETKDKLMAKFQTSPNINELKSYMDKIQ